MIHVLIKEVALVFDVQFVGIFKLLWLHTLHVNWCIFSWGHLFDN